MIAIKNRIEQFIYTNAINPTIPYNPTLTYSVAEEARFENYVYKSVQDNNLGNDPLTTLNISWILWNPANDYAMLDYYRETATNFPDGEDGVVIFERTSYYDSLLIGEFNANEITIEYLDDTNTVIDANDTETYSFSPYANKYNPYWYIYGAFEYDKTRIMYQRIKRIGTRVRITFKGGAGNNYCGLLFAGNSVDFGETLDEVNLSSVEYGKLLAREVNFSTIMDKSNLMKNLEQTKESSNDIFAFVIDPSENTSHNNIVVIGKIKNHSGVARIASKNIMNFTIEQNIRK